MRVRIIVEKFDPTCDMKSCLNIPTVKVSSSGNHLGKFCDDHKEEIVEANQKFYTAHGTYIDIIRLDKE